MSKLSDNLEAWNQRYGVAGFVVSETMLHEQAQRAPFLPGKAKDGSPIDIYVQDDGVQVFMQSQYRPIEEAKRFVKQYEGMKDDSCVLFLGLGNGYIAKELLVKDKAAFVFYEPSIEYFGFVMEHYDIRDLISRDNIHIYVEGINANRLPLEMYYYVHALNWHLFYLEAMPKYCQLYPEKFETLTKLYDESRSHGYQNYDIQNFYSDVHMSNALHNLELIYRGSSVYEYKDILPADMPVIVVAAGPSLEKNVDLLKEYRDRAFILCVDRAAPVLAERGIRPHAFVTVDAKKDPKLFGSEIAGEMPWFAYTTSNYDALKQLKHSKIIFASTIFGYGEKLFQAVGSDLFEMASGGSVATNAVNIAIYMGSRNIIVIGQDLAYTDNKVYAGVETQANQQELIQVKSFDGGTVMTRADYKAFIDYYEANAARRKDVRFINATEGGAYIEGMEHLRLSEAMASFPENVSYDGDAILNGVPWLMTGEKQLLLKEKYNDLMRYFKKIKREVATAITAMEHGINVLKRSDFSNPELRKVEKQMDAFQTMYNAHTGKTILDMGIAKEIQDALLDLQFKEEDPSAELKRLYEKMLTFFQGVRQAVTKAIPILQETLENIEKL